MNNTAKKLVFIIIITLFCICTGCNNSQEDRILYSYKPETDINDFSSNINDYYIEKDNTKPLIINYLSDDDYELLLSDLEGTMRLSSECFEISSLRCKDIDFRKVIKEDELYYCVYGNINNNEKLYMFFKTTPGYKVDIYNCGHYVILSDKNVIESPTADNYYMYIADIDLKTGDGTVSCG